MTLRHNTWAGCSPSWCPLGGPAALQARKPPKHKPFPPCDTTQWLLREVVSETSFVILAVVLCHKDAPRGCLRTSQPKEMLTHGMKGRRGGAEDERKWKGTQKPQETHVGRQAHFSIQRRNPLWPSTIQKVADSQAYSKRPGSQTAHSRVRQRKLKSVIKELDALGVAKQKRRPCDTTQRGAL